jgi:predicted  nucleic acid-binding Zn-ribbon protein
MTVCECVTCACCGVLHALIQRAMKSGCDPCTLFLVVVTEKGHKNRDKNTSRNSGSEKMRKMVFGSNSRFQPI